ncbi:MAG: ribosome recycling factor [Anaerolineae bacterium]|nr:ribosome recycling factor [Anaerolineae bacterium]MDQ7036590.1 ribosome recycling factor [Anaerolineae bacterium]
MLDEILEYNDERMQSTLSVFEQDLQGIRGNRASIGLVDRLMVNYYGQETELRKIANLSTPEPMTITIRPYDPSAVAAIETAINQANIGINPNTDSGIVRLNMPALTRERRQDLVKLLGKRTEQARVSIRNIRRDAMSDIKELEKEGDIGEDESKRAQEKVDNMTKAFIDKIDETGKAKETDIMEI